MPPAADEFQLVRPGLAVWQAYDPAVKTDLNCCAVQTPQGLVFIDPVRLAPTALRALLTGSSAAGILLTNANHERWSVDLAKQLGIEIWASAGAQGLPTTRQFVDGDLLFNALSAVSLEGFAPGETAFAMGDILIFGDALIHAAPYGFSILPAKYCENPKAARASLRKLLQFPAELLTFAHGLPIVSRARERLAALISSLS